MTLLDLLKRLLPAGPDLETLLGQAGEALPELKPQLDDALAKLRAGISQDSLLELAQALPAELMRIAQGHLEPRDHPSDAI